MAEPSFVYFPGPVLAEVYEFGLANGVGFAGMLWFTGADPDPLPPDVRAALVGHIRRGERVMVMAKHPSQMAWAKAQLAVLTAPGGRA